LDLDSTGYFKTEHRQAKKPQKIKYTNSCFEVLDVHFGEL
jgi:hypothetical protein